MNKMGTTIVIATHDQNLISRSIVNRKIIEIYNNSIRTIEEL
jgi:ABC-type ATPase involved in cell division